MSGALLTVLGLLGPAVAPPAAGVAFPAGPVAAESPAIAVPVPVDPNAPSYTEPVDFQPHRQLITLGAEEAWQHSTGAGVTVAVIDSGVDADHPDLAGRVRPGADFVDGSTDGRTDAVGHGTTVASLVAGGNPDRVLGLAPEAEILPIRVLDDDNRYETAATVADGVVWAVEQGASVINLSLGGDRRSGALADALELAMASDVVVIACTGNARDDPDAQVWYPAREPGVVAVAGLTRGAGGLTGWSESLTGPETALAAPAVVVGAEAGGGYRRVQGTSFSSALVAGAAALIRAQWPELPASDVVNRLVATAEAVEGPGRDPRYGFGALDPAAALTEAVPPAPTNPLDTTARHGSAGLGTAPDVPLPEPTVAPPAPAPSEEVTAELVPGQPAGGEAITASAQVNRSGPVWWPLGVLLGSMLLLLLAAVIAARSRPAPGPTAR